MHSVWPDLDGLLVSPLFRDSVYIHFQLGGVASLYNCLRGLP